MPSRRSFHVALTACALTAGMLAAAAADPTAAEAAGPAMTATQFYDGFNGPAGAKPESSTWAYQAGGNWGNGRELQAYTNKDTNASLTGNGTLRITARGETYTGWDQVTRDYTSARLMTRQSVKYGTVSARIRMTGSPGAWPAFWMMGANYAQVGWPACGELDVMEAVNAYTVLYGSFHGPVTGGVAGQSYDAGAGHAVTGGLGSGWHVYSATWNARGISFALDGRTYVEVLKKNLPSGNVWAMDNPQNLILNIAVGGMAGTPAPPADFAATMEVDYVRVVGTTVG